MPFSDELERLGVLNPIAGDNPAGRDLRADGSFRAIREEREEARRIEREAEKQGEATEESLVHWRLLRDKSIGALAEQSKDLEICAYLIEAGLHTDGFAGLRLGLETARALVENFWDGLYPLPDEVDGLDARVMPVERLNGDLLTGPMLRVPITEARGDGPFACIDQIQVEALAGFSEEERRRRIDRGAVTSEQVHRAIVETTREFYRSLLDNLAGCQAEFKALVKALDERAGSHSPPTSLIRDSLDQCQKIVQKITKDMFPDEVDEQPLNGEPVAGGGNSSGGGTAGELKSRDDAFRLLAKVADYFEARDPQSLLAHQIRKIVRMGKMTPAEYFVEMLEDEDARRRLFKSVGIDAPKEE